MNCKRYRACIVGLIAIVLVAGAFLYVKNIKANEVPVDGTLVKSCEDIGEEFNV